jgi:hypothetical protein
VDRISAKTQWRRGREAIEEAAGGSFAPAPAGETLMHLALEYAAFPGWPVFPCKRDKTPYTRHGFKDATTDQDQIRRWWERWPEASIGLPTGRASGVYVVDVDKGHEGTANWQELEFRHGDVLTLQSKTGSGGYHLFFRTPPFALSNTTSRLAPGIDTRGDGGYVILPPSGHPSGSTYDWVHWRRPQPLPRWIVEAVQRRRDEPRTEIVSIDEGVRDNTLASFAGALRNVGADRETIQAALEGINDAVVHPPLAVRDIRRIAQSISRYAPGGVSWDVQLRDGAGAQETDQRDWIAYTGIELAALPEPEVDWVLFPIAAKGIVTLLAGQWKTAGKTTLLISGCNAVLRGLPFIGEPTPKGGVVYLYEGPADEFRQNDFAHLLYHEDFLLVPRDENSGRTWKEAIDYATAQCLEREAALMVVDTKAAWLGAPGEEENQSGYARAAMEMFAEAKLEGIAIVVAAHPTKDATASLAKMVAGSGQWAAAAGRQVGVWVHTDITDPRREIESHGRQGSANNFPRSVIEWDEATNEYDLLGLASEVADDAKEAVREVERGNVLTLVPKEGATRAQIVEAAKQAFGVGRNKVDETLKEAAAAGLIEIHRSEPDENGSWHKVYSRKAPR